MNEATGKAALVCGAGGFIGHHLVNRLKAEGYYVVGADLQQPAFSKSEADEYHIGDLRDNTFCARLFRQGIDEVYQLAADMGGAGYIFTGEHDAAVMYNSAQINLNILQQCTIHRSGKIFYSSSACIYPIYNQQDPAKPMCAESSAYPAQPDSEYGWEKLFSERMYLAFGRNEGLNVRIARFHNIYGPEGVWSGGKEKAPSALCRKVAMAKPGEAIDVWGDGLQTRSFLYIDDCIEGVRQFMASDFQGPINIGSEEMISINDLARLIIKLSGKQVSVNNVAGPTGVRGRNSDNTLVTKILGWQPKVSLEQGLTKTYQWIEQQIVRN